MTGSRKVAAAIAGALLLVACGGGDDDVAPVGSQEPSPAASTPPTSDAEATPDEPAEGEPAGASGGVFRWATSTIPASMDPTQVGSDTHFTYFVPVYESLIRADAKGDLVGGLAEDWTLSADGLEFDLTLREGLQFQDGSPVDADAIVANFEYSMAEESLLAPVLSVIEKVEPIDGLNVRFSLSRPGGDLPEILRGYAGMMMSPAAIDAGTLATQPVGAGPFEVTSITDTQVTYARNEEYWDAESIRLDGIEITVMTDDNARLNAVRSGEIDGTFIRPNQAAEAEAAGLVTVTGPRVFTYGVYLNPSTPEFSDPDVRRAFSMAIDRPAIESFLYDDRCEPAAQLFPTDYWAYSDDIEDEEFIRFDPDAAAALLDEATTEPVEIILTTPSVTAYQRLAEVLQEQLSAVGFTVEVQALDANDVFARLRTGDYSAIVTAFYSSNPDPAAYAEQYYVTEPGGEPLVPELTQSIVESRLTIDRDERASAIGDISATILEAGTTAVPICIPDVVLTSTDNVAGLEVPILGNYDFRNVSFND